MWQQRRKRRRTHAGLGNNGSGQKGCGTFLHQAGLHTHTGNCEVITVLSGSGVCHDDVADVALTPGMVHYGPEGHTHGIDNTGAEPLVLLGVLPDMK